MYSAVEASFKAVPLFDQLSAESQAKVARLGEIVDQFVAADKVVIANPV